MERQTKEALTRLLFPALILAAVIMSVSVIVISLLPGYQLDTTLASRPEKFGVEDYTILHDREHPPALDTDYPYDDCPPVDIEMKLPKEQGQYTYIGFSFLQSWTRIYMEGALIYSYYPEKGTSKYDRPTSIYHLVSLPEHWGGKKIRIEIISTLRECAKDYPIVYLGDRGTIVKEILMQSLPSVFFVLIIFLLALELIWLSLTKGTRDKPMLRRQMRAFAFMLIDISIWAVLGSRVRQFLFGNYDLSLSLISVSYFLAPVFFAHFLYSFENFSSRKSCKVLLAVAWAQFFFACGAYCCGIRVAKLQFLMQITSALLTVYMCYVIISLARKHALSRRLQAVYRSMFWLFLGVFGELLRYFLFSKTGSGVILLPCLLGFTVQYTYISIYNVIEERRQLQLELEHERIRSMMSQMNPHFLYNALTSIQTIVKMNPDYAYTLLYDFSVHLRGTIKSVSVNTIPFEEEMKNVRAYVNIERMRFGEKLKVEYDIRQSDFPVIPLCIQPLVENAIRHGIFRNKGRAGKIIIRSQDAPECYMVQVIDNGAGFDLEAYEKEKGSGEHIGLSNLKFRLREIMGAEMEIQSRPGQGTTVTIRIPKEEKGFWGEKKRPTACSGKITQSD